jgi:hypothetical protein
MGKVRFVLTKHAETVMDAREIRPAWVERTLADPENIVPDRIDPGLKHALRRIPEYDDRILRVVYNEANEPWRVVTVLFDRTMRGKL